MTGSSDTSPAQRARTKAPDFSDLFRSGHGSRHSSRTGAGTVSSPSLIPSPGEKPAGAKTSSRRSMLPFLGRKKPAEQTPAVPAATTRKSVSNTAYPVTPVNTVRRSFGNGHAVLMITPSPHGLPAVPPLPSKLPSMDVHHPSLGSKLAAHFTPLRTPSRSSKARQTQKLVTPIPPLPPSASLSPPVPQVRAPSVESCHSSTQSRSTTPRPLRGPYSSPAENGEEEDFSDLFTLPDQLKKPPQFPLSPSTTSVNIHPGDASKKSGELTPTTPRTPLGPALQFPIPPSTFNVPLRSNLPRYSSELASLSSQGSRSPPKRLPAATLDNASSRTFYSDLSSQDEQQSSHYRTASASGSDTDTSRANNSRNTPSRFKLAPLAAKPPNTKRKLSGASITKTSSGPPPSGPLPSPPPTAGLGPSSAPLPSPNRVVFPRPRANTLGVTSNLVVPVQAIPVSCSSSPTRSTRADSIQNVMPDATSDELREALSQQTRKNTQLQEYIVTITKRYEDDRATMTKTIEKLERNIRKKMREIEGLRWLVIHHGAVSDIDAAANLARSSLSTQEGEAVRGTSPTPPTPHENEPSSHCGQTGDAITTTAITSAPGHRSDLSALSSSTPSLAESQSSVISLSAMPERTDGNSRTERQKLKEERRASKALRRISASLAMGNDPCTQNSSGDIPIDTGFYPKQGMDEVLEKLQPFRLA